MSLKSRAHHTATRLFQVAAGTALIWAGATLSGAASAQGIEQQAEPRIESGRLSWSIDKQPLREVLLQLSEQLGFELTISPKLPPQAISRAFSSTPVDKALNSILSSQNYIIGRNPADELQHIYLFAEGETPTLAPRPSSPASTASKTTTTAKTEKQKMIDDLEALLPPGALTQTMKDALLAGVKTPSEAEIAELRSRQNEIFEEFKALLDARTQIQSNGEQH